LGGDQRGGVSGIPSDDRYCTYNRPNPPTSQGTHRDGGAQGYAIRLTATPPSLARPWIHGSFHQQLKGDIMAQDIGEWRNAVLTEMLKLVTDQWIEVHGVKLQIRTFLSQDYHPEQYPWLADGNPNAPDEDGDSAEFDIVSPLSTTPTDYRYRINLTDT
jgi:hypothetical protein